MWTSAHAEYVASIQDLLAAEATEERVRDLMVPAPELYTVANMSHLLHLGTLTERTASPRCCSKTSQALLSILTRVTNAGSRGWETTLLAALKESEGAVRVCTACLAVALSGLNSAVHPAARRPWRERFVLLRALRVQTQQDFKDDCPKAPERGEGGDPAAPGRHVRPRLRHARGHAAHAPARGPAVRAARSRCRTRRSRPRCTAWRTRART